MSQEKINPISFNFIKEPDIAAKSMVSNYIAVDIGGTRLRAGCYPKDGLSADKLIRIPTRHKEETPLDRLIKLIGQVWPDDGMVKAICVAVPGPTDPYQGIIIEAPNIRGWENLPLKQILEDRFGAAVALVNDANAAAMGEWCWGAGQGHHNLIYLTISTGIGSGIIINDRLLLGAHGLAGELGHTTIMVNGPVCGCGKTGHLEALASGTAMLRWVEEQLSRGAISSLPKDEPLTGKMISIAADGGDELSIQALARTGTYVGIAVASFLQIFNPTAILIGGGVAQSGEFFMAPLRRALEEHAMAPQYLKDLVVTRALFGDEAGLVGALTLARELYPA